MSTSYAYDPNNIGHKYLNSPQFEEDLERVAEQMKTEGEQNGDIVNSSSRHA